VHRIINQPRTQATVLFLGTIRMSSKDIKFSPRSTKLFLVLTNSLPPKKSSRKSKSPNFPDQHQVPSLSYISIQLTANLRI
jgi:hypothetical protein